MPDLVRRPGRRRGIAALLACLPATGAHGVELVPCALPGLEAPAVCATVEVPETRGVPGARTLALRVAVVRATAAHPEPDPLFVLAGGPGLAATFLAPFIHDLGFVDLGGSRDLVFVDLRGTGGSSPLSCEFSDPPASGALGELLPPADVARCRDRLAPAHRLEAFTTSHAVEDLEAVRRELGYSRINLYGTSYGTRVALEMMRRHPDVLRAVVLKSPVPPSFRMPVSYPRDGQATLERVFALCAGDARCAAQFPDPGGDLERALAAFAAGPVRARAGDADGESGAEVELSRGLFGEVLRSQLYSSERYAAVPVLLHRAARGDFSPFVEAARQFLAGTRRLAQFGLFLSVTCAEDLPFLAAEEARREAAATFLGTYRYDQQSAACALWPRGAIPADFHQPVRAEVPTLVLTGELDPVTPPRLGDEIARALPRARHVVVPFGSHSGSTGGCVERIQSEFVRRGSAEELDLSCLERLGPPEFSADIP